MSYLSHKEWNSYFGAAYKTSLGSLAKSLGYPNEYVALLDFPDNPSKEQKIELYKASRQLFDSFICAQKRGAVPKEVNPLAYIKDVLSNWVAEDCLVSAAKKYGFSMVPFKGDKSRILAFGDSVSVPYTLFKIGLSGRERLLLALQLPRTPSDGLFRLPPGTGEWLKANNAIVVFRYLEDEKYGLFDLGRERVTIERHDESEFLLTKEEEEKCRANKVLWAELVAVVSEDVPAEPVETQEIDYPADYQPETPKPSIEDVTEDTSASEAQGTLPPHSEAAQETLINEQDEEDSEDSTDKEFCEESSVYTEEYAYTEEQSSALNGWF